MLILTAQRVSCDPMRAPKRANMPYTITRIETTPNPNARKLLVEPSPGTIRSFFKAEDAQDDPLGSALFSIVGVSNVLIHTKFISISKDPQSNWKSILKSAEQTLKNIA